MDEKLKSFLEKNKELIKENKWCELYDKANMFGIKDKLARFLYDELGVDTLLNCFFEEGIIPSHAFYGCDSLTGDVIISDYVTSISTYAFSYCNELTHIDIPESVTDISWGAFCHCEKLEKIVIPSGVDTIMPATFSNCYKLTEVILQDRVRTINSSAFFRCHSLPRITIPDSVTYIGDTAFADCSSLTSITIPASVNNLGLEVFWNCTCNIIFKCDKKIVTRDVLKGFKGTYEFI